MAIELIVSSLAMLDSEYLTKLTDNGDTAPKRDPIPEDLVQSRKEL